MDPATSDGSETRSVSRGAWILGGVVCGVAWAAALRGYMVELAGAQSTVTWGGTFGALLLPGAVTGGLLGWAEHLRRTGGRPGWRWSALAPLPLALAPLLLPGAIETLTTTGEGSGAIAIALMGAVGGYALAGRGPRWARTACGIASVATALALGASAPAITCTSLGDPRTAWTAVLAVSLYAALALGCAIPFLRVAERSTQLRVPVP
ncbi:hypothetical protein [Occultella kanbiaonis]|uniref:hypothetical protein n=1 Tax=Occultella kanbiaonis TaxID=2675754 RepID=UPI0013D4949D|nr:hypothetical protein [Occultella kanbiaonis]